MKTLILLLFAFACCLPVEKGHAQTPAIDSLEQLLSGPQPDSIRAKIINSLIYYYSDVNTERSIELAKLSLGLIDKINNRFDVGNIYLNNALASEASGEYNLSLEYNAKALKVFESLNDSLSISAILNNIGIGHNQLGDYSMAVYYLLKSIELSESLQDTLGASTAYINMSEVYFNSKNFVAAEQWGKKAYTHLVAIDDDQTLGYAAEMLASAHIERNKLDSAIYFINVSKKIGNKHHNEYLINRNTGHLGRVFLKQKNYDSAQHYLVKAIQQSEGKHYADILLPALLSLTNCYLQMGKTQEALEHAQEAYARCVEVKNKVLALESCALLARVYEAMQKPNETIKYLRLASLYKDTILEQSMKGSIQAKAFDINLENEKRARQQALLGLEQKEKVLIRQRYILALGTVALLSLLTVMFLIRKASLERRNANAQLISNNIQLNKLNQEVNGLINTIVHDLKTPLNSMQGILYVLEQDIENNESAGEMIKQGHRVLEGGHEIIKELLELRELEEKTAALNIESTNLKELIDTIREEYLPYAQQKQIDLKAEVTETLVGVDQHLVKRLLGNLVSNAIKYSPQGSPVKLRAWKNSHVVYFEVADHGQGFKEADLEKMYQKFQKLSARPTGGESSHGLGLAIVSLLVKKLKASIDLKTEWGKGSTFTVTVPLN